MKFRHLHVAVATLAVICPMLVPGSAWAGLYQDDLSRCLVASAKPEDRTAFVRWVFAAMATNPKIHDMAHVSDAQSKTFSSDTARLMQRLVLEDCRKQTIDAIKYENGGAVQQAFGMLGQIAMADLMRDESTSAYMNGLDQYLDKQKWTDLMSEAGIKTSPEEP